MSRRRSGYETGRDGYSETAEIDGNGTADGCVADYDRDGVFGANSPASSSSYLTSAPWSMQPTSVLTTGQLWNMSQTADPDAERAALNARQPHGRLVSAAEVATAVAYLASPRSGSTTGMALAVDGGMQGLRLTSIGRPNR